jgi:hypothetical protein
MGLAVRWARKTVFALPDEYPVFASDPFIFEQVSGLPDAERTGGSW